MNIDFISVGVKNFRSYGNLLTKYEFNNGLDLVVGTNGNGKTSLILHGIVYALYGVGINGENIDTLINDVNKKNISGKSVIDYADDKNMKDSKEEKVKEIYNILHQYSLKKQ